MKETIDVKKDYFRRRDEAHYLMRRIQRYNTKNDVDPRDFRKYRDHLVDHLFDYVPFYNLQNIPNNHMRSQLLILIVVLQISSSEHYVCYNQDPPTLVKLSQLQTKKNNVFHFQIHNNAAPVTIVRNNNGTFIEGAFSTLELSSQRNIYKYTSTSLSFKYPPQHRIVQISNEMVQMQILYELSSKDNSLWKHKHVGLSITFLLTEHGPAELFTIGHQINQNLKNGSILDLKELLHLIPSLNMFLYKGTHSSLPSDTNFIWLIRKELLLMNQIEFQTLKQFIFQHQAKESIGYHGVLSRNSDLNEISQLQIMKPMFSEQL